MQNILNFPIPEILNMIAYVVLLILYWRQVHENTKLKQAKGNILSKRQYELQKAYFQGAYEHIAFGSKKNNIIMVKASYPDKDIYYFTWDRTPWTERQHIQYVPKVGEFKASEAYHDIKELYKPVEHLTDEKNDTNRKG